MYLKKQHPSSSSATSSSGLEYLSILSHTLTLNLPREALQECAKSIKSIYTLHLFIDLKAAGEWRLLTRP